RLLAVAAAVSLVGAAACGSSGDGDASDATVDATTTETSTTETTAGLASAGDASQTASTGVQRLTLELVDTSRPTAAGRATPPADSRTLVTEVYVPPGDGPFP